MIDFNIDNYLRISLTDVVLVCISTFLIVMFAKKFFWEKLLTLIQKRQDLIQENIDSSVAIKKQAEDVKEQYDEKLRNVSQEAHTILVSARAHADQEKQQIIKEANDEALRIKKNANEDIERQKRDAQKEMKKAISDVALSAASQLIKKEMDEETQKQFLLNRQAINNGRLHALCPGSI